jgi:hypothetical protein
VVAGVLGALVATGLIAGGATTLTQHPSPAPSAPASTAPTPNDGFPRPNDRITPGTIDTSLTRDYLCSHSTDDRRRTSERTKAAVYRAYGLPPKGEPEYKVGSYEVDHRVPLWAGGKDELANLWPEPNDHPPGALNSKDILERRLYTVVCKTKTVSLQEAQQAFLGDWVVAFHKYGEDVG